MNPGGTSQRRNDADEGERGEALQNRLSHLAERLERLATAPGPSRGDSGRSMSAAANASDNLASASTPSSYEAPPAWNDLDDEDADSADDMASDPSGMAEIAAALRELDDQPAPAAKPAPASAAAPDPESRLAAIRRRIDALRSRRDEPPPPKARPEAKAPPPATKSLASGEAKAERAATAAAIAERQHAGGAAPAPHPMRPMTPPAPTPVEDKLGMAISALSARNDKPAPAAPAPATVAPAAPAALSAAPVAEAKSDDIAGLSRQLDELRRLIRASAADTDMSALEAGQSVIMERLDQLTRRNQDPGLEEMTRQLLQRVPSSERIDAMSAEIDRLSERVAALDHREELGRIDARLSAFEERLTAAPERAAPTDNPALESAIAAMRESLDGLTRMLHEDGTPAWARLEERLNQVSDRFEATLENAPRADSVADLFERLEALAARGESAPPAIEALAREIADIRAREHSELASLDTHIQALAARLDEAIGGKLFDTGAMEDLEARILALSGRLDDLANAEPSADHAAELRQVEDQLASLSGRIDQIDTSGQSPDGLAELEGQVADLMSRLDQLSTDHSSLLLIQENLSKLEAVVSESGRQSPEAVQQAARDAVRELANLGGAQQGSATLEALKSDLKALQRAAQDNDRQTGATLDKVHETLDRVVMRLSGLEEEIRDRSGRQAEPRRAPVVEPEDEAAPSDADDWMPIPPDQPLVPDAPRPRAMPSNADREMRADFIAAARRAAQAAATEHAIQRANAQQRMQDEQPGDRPKSRFRQMIGENKRPLIIAAGAIVLTIAVLTILQPFGGRDDAAPAPAPQPTIVEPADPDAFHPAAAPLGGAPADATALAALPFGAPFMTPIDTGQIDPIAVGAVPVNDVAIAYPMPDEAVGSLRLRTAASSGDPSALYEVGARYAEGRFVATDFAQAAIWFERAAESGLAVAQYRLAEMYEAGQGVAQDRQTAANLYLAAAEQGNVFAMYNLGMLLNQGVDPANPDQTGAVHWLTAAAEHGIRDAQYNLGVIYARGIGVEIDLVASYQWFAIAAAQGDTDASARRDLIAAALTSDQLATARAAVSAWSVAGAPASANTVPVPAGGWDEPDQRVDAGDQQQLVRTIQALLIERGFDPGPADGVAGPLTYEAVRAFQQMIGIEPTGEINDALLEALNEHA